MSQPGSLRPLKKATVAGAGSLTARILLPLSIMVVVALCGLSACTTTTSLVRVKDESIGRPQYTRIVVSTPTEDLQVRDFIESLFAVRLRGLHVTSYRAMDVLPPLREYTPSEIADRLDSVGAQVLLVVAVTDFWQSQAATPSTTIEKTRSESSTYITQWGGLLSAETSGHSTSMSQTIPGITLTQSNVKLDARVFQIDIQGPPKMIWRSNSTTSGDYFAAKSKVMQDAALKIATALAADSLLKGFSPYNGIVALGGPDNDVLLGRLDASEEMWSIFYEQGAHGVDASQSVWHRGSVHASDTSSCSVCNPDAQNPPIIVDEEGRILGRLTLNPRFEIGFRSAFVKRWLEERICKR